ncbi:MAG: hypothetical protein A2Y18_04910 [Clostridiales bacterium GWD2_32_19]|nr:MAG: hypothetical protein A2Y18_04910 [Clostridiales bacterium GWD2_32_19]
MISIEDSFKYEEYLEYANKIEGFISNEVVSFSNRMIYEGFYDFAFRNELLAIIERLENTLEAGEMEEVFASLHNKTDECFKKSKDIEDFERKFNLVTRGLTYFYFLECLNEYSEFSDDVINKIKDKYSKEYLRYVEKIDKYYLSEDMKKVKIEEAIDFEITPEIDRYLVMKRWQDLQHKYFGEVVDGETYGIQCEYFGENNVNPYKLETLVLKKRLLGQMREKSILSIDEITALTNLLTKEEIVEFVGGKAYGLSVLNSKSLVIPRTYVLPIGYNKGDLIKKIENKIENSYDMSYAIRSSADIEDGKNNSFAGMFDSFLGISFGSIRENIENVEMSVNNKRLQVYIEKNKCKSPQMAVIIQEYREPDYAGVWIGNSEEGGILEWVSGNGEKLVSGKVTPTAEFWQNGQIKENSSLDNEIGKKLIEYQKQLGEISDFEWCIIENDLIMLQFRPVTRIIDIKNDEVTVGSDGYKGVAASSGEITGTGKYINKPNEADEFEEGNILLTWLTDPDWLDIMVKSSGLITAVGGFLCHSAIIARELGIPCVTGIGKDAMLELKKQLHNELYLNGNRGIVKIMHE